MNPMSKDVFKEQSHADTYDRKEGRSLLSRYKMNRLDYKDAIVSYIMKHDVHIS